MCLQYECTSTPDKGAQEFAHNHRCCFTQHMHTSHPGQALRRPKLPHDSECIRKRPRSGLIAWHGQLMVCWHCYYHYYCGQQDHLRKWSSTRYAPKLSSRITPSRPVRPAATARQTWLAVTACKQHACSHLVRNTMHMMDMWPTSMPRRHPAAGLALDPFATPHRSRPAE